MFRMPCVNFKYCYVIFLGFPYDNTNFHWIYTQENFLKINSDGVEGVSEAHMFLIQPIQENNSGTVMKYRKYLGGVNF